MIRTPDCLLNCNNAVSSDCGSIFNVTSLSSPLAASAQLSRAQRRMSATEACRCVRRATDGARTLSPKVAINNGIPFAFFNRFVAALSRGLRLSGPSEIPFRHWQSEHPLVHPPPSVNDLQQTRDPGSRYSLGVRSRSNGGEFVVVLLVVSET